MAHPYWPLFDLVVRTPRLELRYPDDEAVAALSALAAEGIHDPDTMPFSVPWTRFESPYLEQQAMQHYWGNRAATTPERWEVPLAVYEEGRLVGTQSVMATSFRITRAVSTGSWVGRQHQGRGIGKEMRAAVLHLAFDGVGAEVAFTEAFDDNPASQAVTRALGYAPNGFGVAAREGKPARMVRFVLPRERWARRADIEVDGLAPCLPILVGEG